MLLEDADAVRVILDLELTGETGAFEAKVESADTGKERAEGNHWHARTLGSER